MAPGYGATRYAALFDKATELLADIDRDTVDFSAAGPVTVDLLQSAPRFVNGALGTDVFLNKVNSRLPGSDRVYVHCGTGKFSYQNWIDNLRAGKSFVTNGPMLRFTAGGQEPGLFP